jgi:hypothetical protein
MSLLERMSIRELKNAVWQNKNGMVAVGGLPLEWYEDELEKRTGTRRGYHETEEQIKDALTSLGVKGEVKYKEREFHRYTILLNGEEFGIFDINTNTFVD